MPSRRAWPRRRRRRAKELGAVSLSWAVPGGERVTAALVEGTLLKLYSFDRFKSSRGGEDEDGLETLELAGEEVSEQELELGRVGAEATNAARDLQNLPSNIATPTFLAERAAEIADEHEALELELLDREAIVARGMGALAAVAQGTYAEPRLVVLRYRPSDAVGPHTAYVGKAVTFDTGGISIKPSAKMQEMSSTCRGPPLCSSQGRDRPDGPPVTLTAWCPPRRNMPAAVVKPGTSSRDERQDQRDHTPTPRAAILADALAYAVEQGAERIVDWPAHGCVADRARHTYCGLWSNYDAWSEPGGRCDASGRSLAMPLHPEYLD